MSFTVKKQKDITTGEVLLLLLLTFLLHGIFIFSLKPVKGAGSAAEQNPRVSVFCREDVLKKRDMWNLRYALRYTSPEDMVKPDSSHGFSMFHNRSKTKFPEIASYHPQLFSRLYADAADGLFTPRSLVNFSAESGTGKEDFPAEISTPGKETLYPVWLDEKGKQYHGFFLKSRRANELLKRNGTVSESTVLSRRVIKGEPPLIRVVRSCGAAALDLLAEQQLMFAPAPADEKQHIYSVVWSGQMSSRKGEKSK